MQDTDTIFALATPSGKSGVAIIRISGGKAIHVFNFFQMSKGKERELNKTKVYFPGTEKVIDHALVVFFNSPKSFTGEDIVELHTHGSAGVVKQVTELLITIPSFRVAEPGEFTKRSFLHNKLDLTQVEGLVDLIDAETEAQVYQANKQIEGNLRKKYLEWKKALIEILASVEALIDFPDEDINFNFNKKVSNAVDIITNEMSDSIDDKTGELIKNGVFVSIIGPPNAGKSSLINYISKKETSIVSEVPGTTRDVIETHINLGGYPVTIADTAGLTVTDNKIEKEGIRRAIKKSEQSDIVLAIFDGEFFPNLHKQTVERLTAKSILVINKSDLIHPSILNSSIDHIKSKDINFISVKENLGIDVLTKKLTHQIKNILSLQTSIAPLTRQRHRQILNECVNSLNNIKRTTEAELIAEDLRLTLRSLGRLVGKVDIEDVLDELFKEFCIGK